MVLITDKSAFVNLIGLICEVFILILHITGLCLNIWGLFFELSQFQLIIVMLHNIIFAMQLFRVTLYSTNIDKNLANSWVFKVLFIQNGLLVFGMFLFYQNQISDFYFQWLLLCTDNLSFALSGLSFIILREYYFE
jgi:hypothetical protein